MKRNIIITVCAAIVVAAVTVGLRYYITYKKPNIQQEYVLLVDSDMTYGAMTDSIASSGAVRNLRSLTPGRYVLSPGMSNQYIIRMIANGWETPAKVTLRGYIKTLEGLAAFLGRNFEADSADFADVLLNQDIIDSLGFKPETFIGMFIPNTYEFYWTASPRSVIERFHKEYEAFWNGERDRLAEDMGMSRNEVMTLASIVIGETNNTGEMPLIAGVLPSSTPI